MKFRLLLISILIFSSCLTQSIVKKDHCDTLQKSINSWDSFSQFGICSQQNADLIVFDKTSIFQSCADFISCNKRIKIVDKKYNFSEEEVFLEIFRVDQSSDTIKIFISQPSSGANLQSIFSIKKNEVVLVDALLGAF